MIAELKNWLMALIAVSILCAAAESLMAPGGGSRLQRNCVPMPGNCPSGKHTWRSVRGRRENRS